LTVQAPTSTRLSLASAQPIPWGASQNRRKCRIGPSVGNVSKFVCIGLNNADHAAETGAPIPKEPIIFQKAIRLR
jgi:2-keto-4-pentenoate hydratase/2-oxohepta-3-ene-1,7-dioic acid hydratase in catechol pathway